MLPNTWFWNANASNIGQHVFTPPINLTGPLAQVYRDMLATGLHPLHCHPVVSDATTEQQARDQEEARAQRDRDNAIRFLSQMAVRCSDPTRAEMEPFPAYVDMMPKPDDNDDDQPEADKDPKGTDKKPDDSDSKGTQ